MAFHCRIVFTSPRPAVPFETNGDPHRLDLEPRWIRCARTGHQIYRVYGRPFDAGMGNLHFGIAMARRGWLQPSDILNTLDAAVFIEAARCLRAASIDL